MNRKEELRLHLNEINQNINGRSTLIAVSKTFPASDILTCYELGQRDFGENKVQELEEKAKLLEKSCPDIRWHMIGHLQSNKVKNLVTIPNLVSIHSIGSIKLLNRLIDRFIDKKIKIFLQINTSMEDEKSGFTGMDEVKNAAQLVENSKNIVLEGLMTIGRIRTEEFEKETRECFRALKLAKNELEDALKIAPLKLSMGMSSDYLLALEEGADYLRIGSTIFGKRDYNV